MRLIVPCSFMILVSVVAMDARFALRGSCMNSCCSFLRMMVLSTSWPNVNAAFVCSSWCGSPLVRVRFWMAANALYPLTVFVGVFPPSPFHSAESVHRIVGLCLIYGTVSPLSMIHNAAPSPFATLLLIVVALPHRDDTRRAKMCSFFPFHSSVAVLYTVKKTGHDSCTRVDKHNTAVTFHLV